MTVAIVEESPGTLEQYSLVTIAFRVEKRFRIEPVNGGIGGLLLIEESVPPYVKDYDAIPGERPTNWPNRWDLSNWGILTAYDGAEQVGGAAIAWRTPGLHDLDDRDDLAVLWDLRVHPGYRGRGVGYRLFSRALDWARSRNCRRFKVETQNINVPACRFYTRQGCELSAIDRCAYPDLPDEVQLVWSRDL